MLLARYHKSLLEPAEMMIYEAAEYAIANRKYCIEVPGKYDRGAVIAALYALEHDDPNIRISLCRSYLSFEMTSEGVTLYPHYRRSIKDEAEVRRRISEAVDDIVSVARGLSSEYAKELYVHDRILDGLVYNDDMGDPDSDIFSAYGALIDKSAVCKGISYAFMLVLSELDIWCTIISGGSGINHAWNVVCIDGEYYNVDVTYDLGDGDPNHVFFNVCDRYFFSDHPAVIGPRCCSEDMDWFVVNGKKARSAEGLFTSIVNESIHKPSVISWHTNLFPMTTSDGSCRMLLSMSGPHHIAGPSTGTDRC